MNNHIAQEKQKVDTIYYNNYAQNASQNVLSRLPSSGGGTQYFSLYNPIENEAKLRIERKNERDFAFKSVSWPSYCKHFRKVSNESFIKTALMSMALLLMTMGLLYVSWGFEIKMFETITLLQIPVFIMAASFILSFILLILGIRFHQRFLLFTCLFIIVVTLVVEIFTIVWILIRSSRRKLQESLEKLLFSYQDKGRDSKNHLIDIIQQRFSCCGISLYSDWYTTNSNFNRSHLPKSCCYYWPHVQWPCYVTQSRTDKAFLALARRGCLNTFRKYLTEDSRKWLYITLGIVILIMSMILIMIYITLSIKKTSKSLQSEMYSFVNKLVDGFVSEKFSPNLRNYVKELISQYRNMEDITNLLTTIIDTLYYMEYSKPEDLANFILQGKPPLVSQFEKYIRKMPSKKDAERKKSNKKESIDKDSNSIGPPVPNNNEEELLLNSTVPIAPVVRKQHGAFAFIVPYKLKKRMKNVELFLIGFKNYEKKLMSNHVLKVVSDLENNIHVESTINRDRSTQSFLDLPQNLAAFHQKCFGSTQALHRLKNYQIAPLIAESELNVTRQNLIQIAASSLSHRDGKKLNFNYKK